jgi:GDP/UDP-N,N'-diacetylbacillosamine 2-epimerase (hydrolysing)
MRRICYISGTRADFGLMQSTLSQIAKDVRLDLSVIVTGMHLSPEHGLTVDEIRGAGFRIAAEVPVAMEPATGATMARGIGQMIGAFVSALESEKPDIVLLLGDRGEMLAGALAAIHLNIPVAHIHGGERSGTVDEPVRHAISKLSHIHFTATPGAAARLIRMGESPLQVHVTGAPGLDGLTDAALSGKAAVAARFGLDGAAPLALMVFHPVLQEAERAEADATALLAALSGAGCQIIALMPNADAGSAGVRTALSLVTDVAGMSVQTHLARPAFVDVMAAADVMIGNSSAGIIEAASFGTPVINIGRRQNLRERNANVTDVATTGAELGAAISKALDAGRFARANVYGDGAAGLAIVDRLVTYALDGDLLMKVNGY